MYNDLFMGFEFGPRRVGRNYFAVPRSGWTLREWRSLWPEPSSA